MKKRSAFSSIQRHGCFLKIFNIMSILTKMAIVGSRLDHCFKEADQLIYTELKLLHFELSELRKFL